MGNILLISDRPKPYDDLILEFKHLNHDVVTKRYSAAQHSRIEDQIFDVILYELKPSFQWNVDFLSPIIRATTSPIYILGTVSEADEIAYYKVGIQAVIRTPLNASLIAIRISSTIALLEKTNRVLRKIKLGEVEVDLHNRHVKRGEYQIKLTSAETRILRILFNNKNHIVEKDAIIHYAWDDDESATDNALSIHITRLRNKIEHDKSKPIIDTIWGTGYRLNYPSNE